MDADANKKNYLDQLVTESRPETKPKQSLDLLKSPLLKLGIGAAVIIIALFIFSAVLTSGKEGVRDQAFALKLRIDNTLSTLSSYRNDVKSSTLRSHGTSLENVLSNTSRELTEFLTYEYAYKKEDISKKLLSSATEDQEDLEYDLYMAKINARLDSTYARKVLYEISYILSKESSLTKSTKSADLKEILETSASSLENLYDKIEEYYESNQR